MVTSPVVIPWIACLLLAPMLSLALSPSETAPPDRLRLLAGLLVSRTVLFACFQMLIALGFLAAGVASPVDESARWWPFCMVLTNFLCLGALTVLLRREGASLWQLYQPDRERWLSDLGIALALSVVGLVLAVMPVFALGGWLFGDIAALGAMSFRPMPLVWAIAAIVLFPTTQALAELPTYTGYIMPRLQSATGNTWLAILVTGFWLSAQHITAPLIFDWRFIAWRFLMFVPFALFLCAVLAWRPRLLPYLMVLHALLDLQAATMFLPPV